MIRDERKTVADLAARAPELAKLHAKLIAIRDAHAAPAMREIDAFFTGQALRARTAMGHLSWNFGEAKPEEFTFDAGQLLPPSEDAALGDLLSRLAMAIAQETWDQVTHSWAAIRGGSGASTKAIPSDDSERPADWYAMTPAEQQLWLEANLAWDAARPSVEEIAAGALSRAVGIDNVTRAKLAQMISDGAERGYSISMIANGVPDDGYAGVHALIEETYANRSMAIAQYELGTAQNLSSSAQYRAAALESVEVMDDEQESSCDECEAADGDIWDLDEADANPLEHPWCVRAFVPHFSEDEPDAGC